jgi:hypothetical protein
MEVSTGRRNSELTRYKDIVWVKICKDICTFDEARISWSVLPEGKL